MRETRHLARFLVVGVSSVAVDLGVYCLSLVAGLPRAPAKGLGYVAGMGFGFVLNKTWTFASQRPATGEAATYMLLYAVTLGVNIGLNGLALGLLEGQVRPGIGVSLAFLIATGTTTVLNFLGMRFLTFRHGIAERAASQGAA